MMPFLVWACAAGAPVHLEQRSAGLVLEGDAISRVEIRSPAGVPVLVRTFPRALDRVDLPVAWSRGGTWTVRTRSAAGDRVSDLAVAEPEGSLVELEAPLGTDRVPVGDGARLGVVVPPGAGQMIVSTTALRPGAVAITVDGRRVVDRALGTLERASAILPLGGHVEVRTPDRLVAFDVEPVEADPAALAGSLEMGAIAFPADRTGRPEIGRPPGRVTLAAGWWQTLLTRLGLGARARDPYAPWTHVTVPLMNRGDAPLSLLVETKVFSSGGGVDPAFRAPALGWNERQDGSRVLIRVPAASDATAIVPLYVDDSLLRSELPHERTVEVRVTSLGASAPLAVRSVPLAVRTGNAFASLGLVAALLGAVLGNGLVALRLGRWLRAFPTGDLMTTALFATLGFGLGTVTSLAGLIASAVLGPFSPIAVGIVDVIFRFSIGATLVTLVPRPGVVTLSILTEWLLGAMLLGNVNASDVVFVGDRIFLYETALYAAGITRSPGWRDQSPLARWLRLSLAFGLASACTSAVGLVLHMTLYRLFFATWYIVLLVALPGFLYVGIAMLVAVPFAASLRRVAR
jgi:hypothetical protein